MDNLETYKNQELDEVSIDKVESKMSLERQRIPGYLKILIILGILMIVSLTAYYSSFKVKPLLLDDKINIFQNEKFSNVWNFKDIWNYYSNRVIVCYTFALNIAFNKNDVSVFHIVNYLIHFINGVLIFGILRLILSLKFFDGRTISKYKDYFTGAAAMLFLVHPITTGAVTFLYQRFTLMAAMFYFVAVYTYMIYRKTEKRRFFIFSMMATLMAMFSKENAFSIPLMVIAMEFTFFSTFTRKNIIEMIKRTIPYIVIISISVITQFAFGHNKSVLGALMLDPANIVAYFSTQQTVIMKYIGLLFIPINQVFDYELSYPHSKSLFENFAWFYFALYIIFIILAIYLGRTKRLFTAAILWFFTALSVECSVLVLREMYFEHRVYLAIPAFLMLIIFIVDSILGEVEKYNKVRMWGITAVLIVITLIFSQLTYKRNELYVHQSLLWLDVLEKAPENARANLILASLMLEVYESKKDLKTLKLAEILYEKGTKLDSIYNYNIGLSYYNRMNINYSKKKYKELIEETNTLLSTLSPDSKKDNLFGQIYFYRGLAFIKLNDFEKAKDSFIAASKYYNTKDKAEANLKLIAEFGKKDKTTQKSIYKK